MSQRIQTTIEVRYQETDQMGVVYHANYLIWFEIGRTHFIKYHGFDYTDMERHDIVSPVVNVHISYTKPIRYGESVYIETWLKSYDGIRTIYAYEVFDQEGDVAVTGETEHVIVKKDTFRPLSLRKAFPGWHHTYQKIIKDEK